MGKRDSSNELQDCKKYLEKLMQDPDCAPFLEPVAWKEMKLLDYPKVIKRPMDLGTVQTKLSTNKYETAVDFQKDVKLIWKNCMTYNADGSDFFNLAKNLDKKTEKELNKIIKKYSKGDAASAKAATKAPSVEDKAQFCKLLYEIGEVQLGRIIQIIDEECEEALDKSNPDEVEVNVDAIDLATFKKLDALIKGFAKESKKNGTSPPSKKVKV